MSFLHKLIQHSIKTRILALLAASAASFVFHAPSFAQPGDDVIVEMSAAFKREDKAALARLLPRAQGHALESWAAYWELKARLEDAPAGDVQAFFSKYRGTYAEDRLRAEWLVLLAKKRDFASFEADFEPYRMRDDNEVMCVAEWLQGRKSGGINADALKSRWYAIRDADDTCTHAAGRAFEANQLSAADVWREARLSAEASRNRAALNAVNIAAPDAAARASEALSSPARYLARPNADSASGKEVAVLAIIRMAANDVEGAAAQLSRLQNSLSAEQRSYAWAVVGKQANLKLDAYANQYFSNAQNEFLTDDLLGWKVRSALRAGSWRTVGAAIDEMTPAGQKDATWVYWKARSLMAANPAVAAALKQPASIDMVVVPAPTASNPAATTTIARPVREAEDVAQARRLLQSVASIRGFYEQLSLEALGQTITVPARPAAPTTAEREAARLNPGLNRALYMITIGLRAEGVREWNYTTNLATPGGMNDRDLLAAAQFACERQVWDRCINTSERTKAVFDVDQRFPTPFREAVVQRARDINLDPAYVYGLIRQESRFIMDARSHVGAGGLMQVMPATARWTANKIGLQGFKPSDVYERDTNIAIGTAYLKFVLDDFQGTSLLASAAYNAGPGRPRNWRNGPVLEGAIWAENVPFNETRDYVKKVASNAAVYAAIITGQPQNISNRLARIGPRDGAAPADNKDLP
jgi:soluble lytic murein transglycosylase